MVGQGEVTEWFELGDQIATENARIQCTFNIISGEEKEKASQRIRMMLENVQDEKMLSYIAEDEEETAAKLEEMTRVVA